ncbi:MAG TPA: cytochrome b/b6 domain-containing protein [Paracoccus sp. (in: a-proteobacteria)]|nr:cytochrome b/b6 domain-containing protein [Paracoccus sp. (in: a-proteobacteria)]
MTLKRYVLIARVLHWTVAVLIIAAIGLGLYGDAMPYAAGAASARSTFVYALHKTVGVAALAGALPFAVWLFRSPAPRRAGVPVGWPVAVWRLTYWGLLFGMLLMPVTGPLVHSIGPS